MPSPVSPLSAQVLLCLCLLACGPAAFPAERPKKPGASIASCPEPMRIRRDDSPWREYTRDHAEEEAGFHVAAVPRLDGLEVPSHLRPVGSAPALLAIDRARRRVVVNATVFGDLDRADATRLAPGERLAIGTLKNPEEAGGYAAAVAFLIRAELVRTYAHLDARLCRVGETSDATTYHAPFAGEHRYCTQRCESAPLRFGIVIDKRSGAIDIIGE